MTAATVQEIPAAQLPVSGKPKRRYEMLDGLRGWAALSVAVGHFLPVDGTLGSPAIRFFTDTKLAVAVFFVLSGFVLSIAYVDRAFTARQAVANIVARHLRLALPILAVSLLVAVLFAAGQMRNAEALPQWGYADFYRFDGSFADAIRFGLFDVFFAYDANHTYIPPAWTMRTELLGSYFVYVVLFGMTLIRFRINGLRTLVLVSALAAAVYAIPTKYIAYFLFTGYFFAGMVLAVFFRRVHGTTTWNRAPIALFMAILVLAAFRPADRSAITVFAMACAVIWAVLESPRLASLFESRLSGFLGRLSFTLYLVHVPIYCTFSAPFMAWLRSRGVATTPMYVVGAVVSIALVILVAWLLYPVERLAVEVNRRVKEFVQRRLGADPAAAPVGVSAMRS